LNQGVSQLDLLESSESKQFKVNQGVSQLDLLESSESKQFKVNIKLADPNGTYLTLKLILLQ